MSDVDDASSKPGAKRDARTDNQAFTQVEKWLAMIREIDREPQPERKRAESARRAPAEQGARPQDTAL
jgi:hypothetical protein